MFAKLKPKFLLDYHTYGPLTLYPEGWQVETYSTDTPVTQALAGYDDDHPAVVDSDPDVSGELYTTNGDVTGHAYNRYGSLAYTVELTGGSGPAVGGTVDGPNSFLPGGFVFQDSEADVQAEFNRNVQFALDLARSANNPGRPKSYLGNVAPDFVPTTFKWGYGDPQLVEVNANRDLGPVAGALARQRRRRAVRADRASTRAASATTRPASTTTSCGPTSPGSRRATRSRCGSPRAPRSRRRSPSRRRSTSPATCW